MGDLQVANGCSKSVDVIVPGSGELGDHLTLAALGNGADISSIPEPALSQLEARLPGVQTRMLLQQGSRTVR